ncbi:hypothetical protein [Spiroplasma eriocheiris]|uniref:Uncharacterized protein n=1 Tax=Spiroplasma eriocheiris TaxID=315358 RepID=A0A0H3XGR0_9MOLU|nr:hypothetical protein [Spiroplasma eriocheiris]AHF57201.1 hypothetical protein SPE_0065 [Spiroplasma eriocheiris CCTCC M 207170]AKM53668.1 hypothetical protein SERIO_v1c00660 [Spiroplasma eriocheiris]
MPNKSGLNAEAIFFTGAKPKVVYKEKVHFVENLPMNSRLTLFKESNLQEGDYVVVGVNVFKVSLRIIKKHPVKKTFESGEYRLSWVDALANLPKIQTIVNEHK